MTPFAGPFALAAALLLLGGAFKAARPDDTVGALRALRVPSTAFLVRAGGALEAAVGAGALAFGDRLFASLTGASYLAFTVFVAAALASGTPVGSCGCFGRAETPPSVTHVVINAAASVSAAAVVIDPGVAISGIVAAQPLLGIPYLLLLVVGVYLAFLSLTLVPRVRALARGAR